MNSRMIAFLLFCAASPPALSALADEALPTGPALDLSAVTAIRITGAASAIDLTTREGEPFTATLGGKRAGWFAHWTSIWSDTDCRTESRMSLNDTTLFVDASTSSWLDTAACRVELKGNVPKEVSISIEQAASQVKLVGDFATIALDNKAADVTLEGHAGSVQLKAAALRSHLNFDRTEANETLVIAAVSQDSYLSFAADTAISYTVEAKAAMVDSALPNAVGARPSVVLRGDYVRATIR